MHMGIPAYIYKKRENTNEYYTEPGVSDVEQLF